MERSASVIWRNGFREGKGTITTESGALDQTPYSRSTRFEKAAGTNPEELIAAALASCFTMALAFELERAAVPSDEIQSEAIVTLEQLDGGWTVTRAHLEVTGNVPGMDQLRFEKVAEGAKANCPISRLLNAKITLTARLESEQRSSQAV